MSAPAALAWSEAVVDEVRRQTPRMVSLFLRSTLAPHRAGQHVDLRLVAEDGYEARRSYSIASAPGAERLELLVERLDDGEVSPYLTDVLQAGDTIELRGPIGGHFVWLGDEPGPLLLVAGGSGIAPVMAMLRHRAAVAPHTETLLLYSVRTWAEMAYAAELQAMAGAGLRFVVATTREAARRHGDIEHRLDRPTLAVSLHQWGHAPQAAYVCGSTGFVEAVTSALVDEGVPAQRVRAERYGASA